MAANSAAIGPPSVSPMTAVCPTPAASSATRASSIHSSMVGSRPNGTGSDTPEPRLSKQTTWLKPASRSRYDATVGSSHMTSRFWAKLAENRTDSSPEPNTW